MESGAVPVIYKPIFCKEDEVASCAIPAKWCLLEYMNFVETFAIIVRGSLDVYCDLGLGTMSPHVFECFINKGLREAGALLFKKKYIVIH